MSVTLTEPAALTVIQRNSNNYANIVVSGTYAAESPNHVQARIVLDGTSTEVVPWQVIDRAPAGGTFSGTLTFVPSGGWYNIQVRTRDAVSTVLSTDNGSNEIGVGLVIGCVGQSNAENLFTDGSALTAAATVVKYTDSGWSATIGGDGGIALGNMLATVTGFPIGLLHYGVGATALRSEADSGAGYWLDTSSNEPLDEFLDGVAAATALSANPNRLEAIVWAQGERDAASGVVTTAEYLGEGAEDGLSEMFALFRATVKGRAGLDIPIISLFLARGLDAAWTDSAWQGIRTAQITARRTFENLYPVSMYDLALSDDVHFTDVAQQTVGQRAAAVILGVTGESGKTAKGPSIGSITPTSATTWTVEVDQDLDTGDTAYGREGFRLDEGGNEVFIVSAARTGARSLELVTFDEAMTTYFYDAFDDTDGVDLDVHTPDVDLSSAGWTQSSGTCEVQTNRAAAVGASPGGPGYVSTFDGGSADGVLEFVVTSLPSGTATSGVVFRYQDNDELWAVLCRNNATDGIRLYSRTGGAFTVEVAYSPAQASTFQIKIALDGNTIRVYHEDELVITHTNSFLATETGFGVRFSAVDSSRISDIRWTPKTGTAIVQANANLFFPYGAGEYDGGLVHPRNSLVMPNSAGTVQLPAEAIASLAANVVSQDSNPVTVISPDNPAAVATTPVDVTVKTGVRRKVLTGSHNAPVFEIDIDSVIGDSPFIGVGGYNAGELHFASGHAGGTIQPYVSADGVTFSAVTTSGFNPIAVPGALPAAVDLTAVIASATYVKFLAGTQDVTMDLVLKKT